MRTWILCLWAAALTGCSAEDAQFTEPVCGNGGAPEDGEGCDDGNAVTEPCPYGMQSCMVCDAACQSVAGAVSYCGDGAADPAAEACDDANPRDWDGCDRDCTSSVFTYVKASNTDAGDHFGHVIALSADGSTLAVAARLEDSAAIGTNGDQTDNSAGNAGAVYVFTRSGAAWIQQAYVKPSTTGAADFFGISLALSADGSTLAVGATGEDSAATGVGGNPANNTALESGAAYVFTRSGATWTQQAYIKASNTEAGDAFGISVALSADGSTLAVGATGEDSAVTGIDGNPANNTALESGAVYVFTRSGTAWRQQAYVKASNTNASDQFGSSVALSGDGSTLAVSAIGEDSASTGVDGIQLNNAALESGAVYVFARTGAAWAQQTYVKASNTGPNDVFGQSLALSADGATLAVGAHGEDSPATGVDGDQASNAAASAGAAYVFARSGATWAQEAYVKASNTGANDLFGWSVALSGDGSSLAVAARGEASAATGVGGDQMSNAAAAAGAVYVLARSGTTWSHQTYAKASNTGVNDLFGWSVALSGDGSILAASARNEASAAIGIDSVQDNNAATQAGAVYLFH